MASPSSTVHYIRRNFDEAAILAVAAKLAFADSPEFSESELATIAAMQRAHPQAGDTPEELGRWLAEMDEDQINGVVNNTKGVLHEMEFVRLENEDGDSVHTALFESTNHAGYDVQFIDSQTGAVWQVQMKATDDASYVQDWMEAHPDGEIVVTEELATEMGLPSSGQTNEELTVRTEDLVDRLITISEEDSVWDYFPGLATASVAIVVWELWQRYRRGEISLQQFKWMTAKATGLKAGKLALLSLALMTPGLSVATAAGLLAKLIYTGAEAIRAVAAESEGRGPAAHGPRPATP